METLNIEDTDTVQIQSVDNIVNEIRNIADNLYKDVSNPEESRPFAQSYSQTPQTSQTNFFRPPSTEFIPKEKESQSTVESKAPAYNAVVLSEGLSKLHARVDQALRGSGIQRSAPADQNLVNSTIQAIKARQSFQSGAENSQAGSNIPTGENPNNTNRQSIGTNPTNYASVPRTSFPQKFEPLGNYPGGTTAYNPTTSSIPQEGQYSNPFSGNIVPRPEQSEATRQSMVQETNRTIDTQNYLSNPPMITSQLSPSALSFVQSNYFSNNPAQNLLRGIKGEEKPIRALPFDGAVTRPFIQEPTLNTEVLRNFQSPVNVTQTSLPQGTKPTPVTATVTTSFQPGLSASTLQPSASTTSLNKTNTYDKSKLDNIISSIKLRESGIHAPLRPSLREANVPAPLTQSNFLSPTSAAAFLRTTQEPDTKKLRTSSTFTPAPIEQYNTPVYAQNIQNGPLKQSKIDDFISHRTVESHFPPQGGLSYSRMLSPGPFQSPQNLLSPTAQMNFPSNPFNQQQQRASRFIAEEEEPQQNDYYGILQAQNEGERARRQKVMSPNGPRDIDRPSQEYYYQQQQQKAQVQPQVRSFQAPSQARTADNYFREAQIRERVIEEQQPRRRGSARQERFADRQPRIEVNEPVHQHQQPQRRQQQQPKPVSREEEFYHEEAPQHFKNPQRGVKRKLDGGSYVREEPEGFFCGGVENDEESVMEDYEATKGDVSGPRRRPNFQENPKQQVYKRANTQNTHNTHETDTVGKLEDDSEESLSPIPRDSDQNSQQRSMKKSLASPLQERGDRLNQNQIPLYYNNKANIPPRKEQTIPSEEKNRSRRRSRSRNRPALGGGELVYTGVTRGSEQFGGLQKKPVQSFGKEQRQGGSVPRRVSKERGNIDSHEFVMRDENGSMRNSKGFQESRGYQEVAKPKQQEQYQQHQDMLFGSSEKKVANQRRFLNNEEELSDFDFEVNKEVEEKFVEQTPEVGRKKRMKQARAEDDSVTRAFEHAKYENSDKKNILSYKGTVKTEMVLNGGYGARRRVLAR